jgi:putative IMPACT (imprinted ancient) family translation regulator
LEVINGKELTNILIVVTRYFGGTLLGTGGLVRAYSQSAQAGIMASKVIRKEVGYRVSIDTDYNGIGKLQYVAMQNNIAILDTQYTDKVQMILLVPIEQTESLLKEVTEATAGQSVWSQEKEPVHFAVIDKEVVVF